MKEYPSIKTVFERDPENKYRTLIAGKYAAPEFAYLRDCEWQFTEKVDGANIRVMIADGNVTFGGKTDNAQIPAFLVARLQELFLSQKTRLLEMFEDGGCLYGEGYGAKIQKGGGNYRQDQSFVLFDVKVGDWWLRRDDVAGIGEALGVTVVPIIGSGPLVDMVAQAKDGFDSTWGPFPAEGIVARPACELQTRAGLRVITKIKSRDFAA